MHIWCGISERRGCFNSAVVEGHSVSWAYPEDPLAQIKESTVLFLNSPIGSLFDLPLSGGPCTPLSVCWKWYSCPFDPSKICLQIASKPSWPRIPGGPIQRSQLPSWGCPVRATVWFTGGINQASGGLEQQRVWTVPATVVCVKTESRINYGFSYIRLSRTRLR